MDDDGRAMEDDVDEDSSDTGADDDTDDDTDNDNEDEDDELDGDAIFAHNKQTKKQKNEQQFEKSLQRLGISHRIRYAKG